MIRLHTTSGETVSFETARCLKAKVGYVSTSRLCLKDRDHDGRHDFSEQVFERTSWGTFAEKVDR
jgi:hypothetical protein